MLEEGDESVGGASVLSWGRPLSGGSMLEEGDESVGRASVLSWGQPLDSPTVP